MDSNDESKIVIHVPTIQQQDENTLVKQESDIDFDIFCKNEPDKWNFNEMYIRSNSPIASNFNSDIESEIKNSFEQTSSVEEEYISQYKKQPIHRKIKDFDFKRLNDIFANRHYYNEDDMSNSQLDEPELFDIFNRSMREYEYKKHKRSGGYAEEASESKTGSTEDPHSKRHYKKYKKFTYEDIEKTLCKYYDKNEKPLTEIDLLVTYLNGLRVLYNISRNITQLKSYSVALTTISITICLAVVAPFVKDVHWGSYLISAGNALATILLTLSRYLKFDSNSAQYAFMAKQFNKMLTRIEYEHTIGEPSSKKMNEIESTMMEMNEYIQELIPEEAVKLFPIIYRTNIIKFIKKQEHHKKNLIVRFRDIKNEIHYIMYKWNSSGETINNLDIEPHSKTPQKEREKRRVLYLMDLKEKTKTELIQCKSTYNQLDELFKKEIHYAETHQCCVPFSVFFKPNYDCNELNPTIRDYLKLTIPD
jgi:hypothetical protein